MEFTLRDARVGDAPELAALRTRYASADRFDEHSTMESLPSADDLLRLIDDAGSFRVAEIGGTLVGYGFVRWWDEATGIRVVLCDWYLDPEHGDSHSALLADLEAQGRALAFAPEVVSRSVLGVNASSVQPERAAAIEGRGYAQTFAQVEMELRGDSPAAAAVPEEFTVRPVVVGDAAALIGLTERVWSGREYFSMPTVASFEAWLARSDLAHFDVAVNDGEIVAFVAGVPRGVVGEIDDVQVDPRFQRRGIASALVARTIVGLRSVGCTTVRLNTEGHDPAGARSLYERLGFEVVRTYWRYRKPLDGPR